MSILKFSTSSILLIICFSCKIFSEKNQDSNNTWEIKKIKKEIKSNYGMNDGSNIVFFLAFEDAQQRNYYHMFDENKNVVSYKTEINENKLDIKKYKAEYSEFFNESVNNIIRDDYSLILDKSKQCDDCHCVKIYKFLILGKSVRLKSDSLISDFYIGPLE